MCTPRRRLAKSIDLVRLVLALVVMVGIGVGCRAQNSGDTPPASSDGVPQASFSQDRTAGAPGLTVQFSNDSTGEVTSLLWDFGNGTTSSAETPLVSYPNAGRYTVALTATGPRGTSTMSMPELIVVEAPPVAGFSCTPTIGFAPLLVACTDASSGGGTIAWDFGDGTGSSEASPQHTFSAPGLYTVTQTRATATETSVATQMIEVLPFVITATPPSGSMPGIVNLVADTGRAGGTILQWSVDGFPVDSSDGGNTKTATALLASPGTHTIEFFIGDLAVGVQGMRSIEYVVSWGAPVAAFSPSVSEGAGPLVVTLQDQSIGDLVRWDWDFGDGDRCTWPAIANPLPSDPPTCTGGSSPRHTYMDVGRYDVTLTVTGRAENPADPDLQSLPTTVADAVSVLILDPSFENQAAGAELAEGWEVLPASSVGTGLHVALSTASGGADAGMPTDGGQWALLDGEGTDGSTTVVLTDQGIQQKLIASPTRPVLEFDYVLIHSEPPASNVLDGITATVIMGDPTVDLATALADGRAVEITSARADVASAYDGASARFPTIDGSPSRAGILRTASLDLEAAFPSATPDTEFTLAIRLANDVNGFRSPRAYVDNIRFADRAPAGLVAGFLLETNPVVAGQPTSFMDETSCLLPNPANCPDPTSYRWHFDTRALPAPPDATGSGLRDPVYVFPAAGVYDVTLVARLGEQESQATLSVPVLEGPVADFDFEFIDPMTGLPDPDATAAPATLRFTDRSTSDPREPIDRWTWDLGGWGSADIMAPASPNPPDTLFQQSGDWTVRLTITTASGLTSTRQVVITVD